MTDYLVTHIRKDGPDIDRRIDQLGGPAFGPSAVDHVIQSMFRGDRFFIHVQGFPPVFLEVCQHPISRRFFVRTTPDGVWDNNLYALPDVRYLSRGSTILTGRRPLG